MRFHIYSKNLVLDLPSVVLNGDDFMFFTSHDISDLKISKMCPLLKTTKHLVESGRENPKIFKKILELAFSHFGHALQFNELVSI